LAVTVAKRSAERIHALLCTALGFRYSGRPRERRGYSGIRTYDGPDYLQAMTEAGSLGPIRVRTA